MELPDLSIVLPCYNEADSIPIIVEKLSEYRDEINFELILVNNGSTDNTKNVLDRVIKEYNFVNVVTIKDNIGYGHGIMSGLESAKADVLTYSHADIQTPPEDIIKAYYQYQESEHNIDDIIIKGTRISRKKDDYFFTKALTWVVNLFLGYNISDINGQPKLFSKYLLKHFDQPLTDLSFDAYVLYIAKVKGKKLITFPVNFNERIFGQSHMEMKIYSRYHTITQQLISIFLLSWRYRWEENNFFWQLIRFSITSLFINIINYLVFLLFYIILDSHYLFGSLVGFLTGHISSYYMHLSFHGFPGFSVFREPLKKSKKQMIKYSIVAFISLIIYSITITVAVEFYNIIPEIGQIIAIVSSALIIFIGLKLWAFRLGNVANNILLSWKK